MTSPRRILLSIAGLAFLIGITCLVARYHGTASDKNGSMATQPTGLTTTMKNSGHVVSNLRSLNWFQGRRELVLLHSLLRKC